MRCALGVSVTVALLGACAANALPPPPPASSQPAKRAALRVSNRGMGPITKTTRVTLTALRELFAPEGLTVKPEFDSSLSFDVYDGDKKLFYVVGNDDGTMLYVHALSSVIKVDPHPSWGAGRAFYDDDMLSFCDCWGTTTVCWKSGEHVAVGFSRSCDGLDTARGRRVLQGLTIARVIWSPTPFRREDDGTRGSELLPDGIDAN